ASEIWYGIMVPSGTPREIISRLHAECIKLLKLPDVKEKLDAAGFASIGTTPDQFGTYIRSEIEKWAKVVKMAGAGPDRQGENAQMVKQNKRAPSNNALQRTRQRPARR